ncbi:MAG TPA: acyl-CoA dehydrogenase family protein [Steroidobacteraceae bacterium]|nr:acyl-CoA dehydrogenase family protein [Steroidobacteraceae bacterium]
MQQSELIARAAALAPLVREHAERTESERDVPPEVFRELVDAGFFRILRPARYGGFQMNPEDLFDVVVAAASGCGSTAWVLTLVAFHPWFAGLLGEEGQKEVLSDGTDFLAPVVFAPLGKATRVDGGYRVTGQWAFCTGCTHANWVGVVATIKDEEGRKILVMPRRAECTVLDTWHSTGLRGTGSHDVRLDDVFVPDRRILDFQAIAAGQTPGGKLHDTYLYRMPSQAIISLIGCAPAFAIARGAIDEFESRARTRSYMYGTLGEQKNQVGSQMRLARAHAAYDACEALLRAGFGRLRETSESGEARREMVRGRIRMQGAYIVNTLYDAVASLFTASGASALTERSPIQRAYRNISAMATHHAFAYDGVAEQYGRLRLGLDPDGLI